MVYFNAEAAEIRRGPQRTPPRGTAVRIVRVSHAAFAAVMIGFGIRGLIRGDLTVLWEPVPKGHTRTRGIGLSVRGGHACFGHRPALATHCCSRCSCAACTFRPLVAGVADTRSPWLAQRFSMGRGRYYCCVDCGGLGGGGLVSIRPKLAWRNFDPNHSAAGAACVTISDSDAHLV